MRSVRTAKWMLQRGAHGHSATALDCAPLLFTHPAPNTGVLSGAESPLEAVVGHRTTPADRLGLLDLQQGRAGRPDREEQLRVLVAAGSTVAPVHGGNTPWLVNRSRCVSYIRLAVSIPGDGPGNRRA